MSNFFAKLAGLLCATLVVLTPLNASAQTYPDRPITFYISIAPGSVFEATFRLLAVDAAKKLGQPIVVENKVGAGGKIGLQALMGSPNDGYTIGMTFNGVVVTRAILDKGFDIEPGKSYAPVTISFASPFIIAANASAPFNDLQGMLAYAKANPGKLSVSGTSPSSNSHLSWELLKVRTGIDIIVVNHRGEAPAVVDLLNGTISAAVVSSSVRPHIEAGKMKGIVTTGIKRWSAFPDVPTIAESGVKDFNVFGWYGIVAPAGTPAAIVAKLNEAFDYALAQPSMQSRMKEHGMVEMGSSPEEFAELIRSSIKLWRPVMAKAGLKL